MAAHDELSLADAAEQLGVHYMTAYRYIRTGRLPATKVGQEWRIRRADLDALRSPTRPGRARRVDWASRLTDRLLAADEAGAWAVTEQFLAGGGTPERFHTEVLGPSLTDIGDRWADGALGVDEEHRATAVATRLLGRLGPLFARRGRTRGTVLLGAPAGDAHALPSAMVADLLRAAGFAVVDLGADVPASSWSDAAAGADRLVAVGVSATAPGNERQIRAAVRAVRRTVDVPVLLGGAAVGDATVARQLGATHHSASALDAVAVIDALASGRAA